MNSGRTTFAITLVASLVVIAATGGWGRGVGVAAAVLSWWVGRRADSLLPILWMVLTVASWLVGGTQSLWRAALVGLALGAVHMACAIGARAQPSAPPWPTREWRRLVLFLAVSTAAIGLLFVLTILPVPSGAIWTLGAVVVLGGLLAAIRFSVREPAGTSDVR